MEAEGQNMIKGNLKETKLGDGKEERKIPKRGRSKEVKAI